MNASFPRLITLLRKEKGISQKNAAAELGISQALLSHYEKGIRECGLDFLVRCAEFYGVSCDYLLGLSPDRDGSRITVDDIPEPDAIGRENMVGRGNIMPVLNKKLIANSMNILFDLMGKYNNRNLTAEMSSYLMLSVYRMFRIIYSSNAKNQDTLFSISPSIAKGYCTAAMNIAAAKADELSVACAKEMEKQGKELTLTTEGLSETYPLFAQSLLNLIQNSENKMKFDDQ